MSLDGSIPLVMRILSESLSFGEDKKARMSSRGIIIAIIIHDVTARKPSPTPAIRQELGAHYRVRNPVERNIPGYIGRRDTSDFIPTETSSKEDLILLPLPPPPPQARENRCLVNNVAHSSAVANANAFINVYKRMTIFSRASAKLTSGQSIRPLMRKRSLGKTGAFRLSLRKGEKGARRVDRGLGGAKKR